MQASLVTCHKRYRLYQLPTAKQAEAFLDAILILEKHPDELAQLSDLQKAQAYALVQRLEKEATAHNLTSLQQKAQQAKVFLKSGGKVFSVSLVDVATDAVQEVGTNLKSITFQHTDEFVNVIVHSEGNGYVVWIDNVKYVVDEKTLAQIIAAHVPADKTIRLLSCSSLESAHQLSVALQGRVIEASQGAMRLFSDGTVEASQWKRIKGTSEELIDNPVAPTKTTNLAKFVQLGSLSKAQKQRYQQLLLSPQRQADVLAGRVHQFTAAEQAEFDALENLAEPFLDGQKSAELYLDGLTATEKQIYINLQDELQRLIKACGGACNPASYSTMRKQLEYTMKEISKEGHIADILGLLKANADKYAQQLQNLKNIFPQIEQIVSSKAPYRILGQDIYLGEIGLTHILARHHIDYLISGHTKLIQSNFPSGLSITNIVHLLDRAVNELNKTMTSDNILELQKVFSGAEKETNFKIILDGNTYVLGIRKGETGLNFKNKAFEIRQFYME